MKIVLDTNILLDVVLKREKFYEAAFQIICESANEENDLHLSATAVTDIYYIVRKYVHSSKEAKEIIKKVSQLVQVEDTLTQDIYSALDSPIDDFEDAVVDAVAQRIKADYIVTRNERDFNNSKIKVVSPKQMLNILKSN